MRQFQGMVQPQNLPDSTGESAVCHELLSEGLKNAHNQGTVETDFLTITFSISWEQPTSGIPAELLWALTKAPEPATRSSDPAPKAFGRAAQVAGGSGQLGLWPRGSWLFLGLSVCLAFGDRCQEQLGLPCPRGCDCFPRQPEGP